MSGTNTSRAVRCIAALLLFGLTQLTAPAQTTAPPAGKLNNPCMSRAESRQFDFWVGEWDAYNPQGPKAGRA